MCLFFFLSFLFLFVCFLLVLLLLLLLFVFVFVCLSVCLFWGDICVYVVSICFVLFNFFRGVWYYFSRCGRVEAGSVGSGPGS